MATQFVVKMGYKMCVWFLESSTLTAGKTQHAAAVDELCTAYEDWTFTANCGGIKYHIYLLSLYL